MNWDAVYLLSRLLSLSLTAWKGTGNRDGVGIAHAVCEFLVNTKVG
jgi:hypothetical protein